MPPSRPQRQPRRPPRRHGRFPRHHGRYCITLHDVRQKLPPGEAEAQFAKLLYHVGRPADAAALLHASLHADPNHLLHHALKVNTHA